MQPLTSNLSTLIDGCNQIDRNLFDGLIHRWRMKSNSSRSLSDFLYFEDAGDCTYDELQLLESMQSSQICEREMHIEEYGLHYGYLWQDWFAKTTAAPTLGVMQATEPILPQFAFANSLLKPSRANALTVGLSTSQTISDTKSASKQTVVTAPAVPQAASNSNPELPAIGEMIGRCLIEKELGRGASSVVYLARHTKLGIRVAVKVLVVGSSGQQSGLLRTIEYEARLLAQINHPNVVRVFDVEDEGKWPCLVLEYVEGVSLATAIERGPLDIIEVIRIALYASRGLAAAYRLGVIHRDIKPHNITLTDSGQVKVVDFGVGLTAEDAARDDGSQLVGTAQYISPEQVNCERGLDHRSDMYSLGATLYHALTGKPPFGSGSFASLLDQHLSAAPVPPRLIRPEIPVMLEAIVLKLLCKQPDQRYRKYDELMSDLRRCLTETLDDSNMASSAAQSKKPSIVNWLSRIVKT